MSRPDRKVEIERIRREGADAFRGGRSPNSIPQEYRHSMNEHHWLSGFREAEFLYEVSVKDDLEQQINGVETIDDIKIVLHQLAQKMGLIR